MVNRFLKTGIIFYAILFGHLGESWSSNFDENKQELKAFNLNCIDPSSDELSQKLALYKSSLNTYTRKVIDEKIKSKSIEHHRIVKKDIQSENDYSRREDDDRLRIISNRTQMKEQSMCKWTYEVEYRSDRYPNYLSQVKCQSCECGINLPVTKPPLFILYECQPVVSMRPVLVKGTCLDDSIYYQWTPSLEPVTESCVCALKEDFSRTIPTVPIEK